jgi:predicted ATP-dependent endonuclease of OLD family
MIFEFKNLGSIKEAQIEMGNLTVICGKNNTGKTYLTYAVYGFLKNWLHILSDIDFKTINIDYIKSQLKEKGVLKIDLDSIIQEFEQEVIPMMSNTYIKKIHQIFNANKQDFNLTEFIFHTNFVKNDSSMSVSEAMELTKKQDNTLTIELNNKEAIQWLSNIDYNVFIKKILFENLFFYSFIITAAREGIQLFQKEIYDKRSKTIGRFLFNDEQKVDREDFAKFSQPIYHNIDFARADENMRKSESFLSTSFSEIIQFIEKEILGIEYYYYLDFKYIIVKQVDNKMTIPHYMASTSVRSLADLHLWLKHRAQKGDLLMIDEPELNLHPENQIKMARLFAKLVNAGIRVWVTTHSDYIVKELNNCIMLGNVSNRTEILEKYKGEYSENDILKAEDLKAYIAYNLPDGGSTVRKIEIDKYGMMESTFDETIDKMNEISQTFADNID